MPTLRETYNNPTTSTRDPALLAKRAGTTRHAAQAFLRDLPAAQLSQRAKTPKREHYAPTGGPHGEWLIDTLFLREYAGVNSKRGAILTVVNPNTRYAYARALVTDAGAEKRGVSAKKTAAALEDILRQNAADTSRGVPPILAVRSDSGGENRGELAALLRRLGIEQGVVEAGTHSRMARLDAFHRSLRFLIGDLMTATNSHVWFPHLEALVVNYNSRPNQGLATTLGRKMAPADVTPDDEADIQTADLARAAEVRQRTDTTGVGPGSRVRLLVSRSLEGSKNKFAKGNEQTWTSRVYVVEARAGPNSFTVKDADPPTWPIWALLPVSEATPNGPITGPKVNRRVVSAQNAEYRARSGVEQAAALAAPARPRSARAPRVDYAPARAPAAPKKGAIVVGGLYASKWGQPALVHATVGAKDLEVSFPSDPDDPVKVYTVARKLLTV